MRSAVTFRRNIRNFRFSPLDVVSDEVILDGDLSTPLRAALPALDHPDALVVLLQVDGRHLIALFNEEVSHPQNCI